MTTALAPDAPERFRTLVARRLGLQFEDAKLAFLAEVLQRRADARGEPSEMYLARLATDASGAELGALAGELTVGETYFFRNIDQFHAFVQVALPARMRAQATSRRLRILSAGCASGDEAYSLAILIREARLDSSWNVSIRAVDINPAMLVRAARARFTKWALRETRTDVKQAWFRQDGHEVVLDEAIRTAVEFEEGNLTADDPRLWQPGAYDAIFCRNVLMYLTPEHAQSVVTRITRALTPGGYLFLGHVETLRGLSEEFHLRHTHGAFYYQRKEVGEAEDLQPGAHTAIPDASSPTVGPALAALVDNAETWVDAIHRAAERIQSLTEAPNPPTSPTVVPAPRLDLGLALDLLRKERFTEALAFVRALPVESKRDPDVLLLQSLLLAHSGQLAAAEDACQQLLALNELNAGAHYILALCREGVGDRRGAADHDQMATYLDPLFAMPRLHLGLLARRAGKPEIARSELSQAFLLFQREDASRLLLFGGGFTREALIGLCRAELEACGGHV
jgi:chemotaxis protein methyltransferase CheR